MHEPGFWGAGDREEPDGWGVRKELSAQLDWDGWVRGNMDIFIVSSTYQGSSTVSSDNTWMEGHTDKRKFVQGHTCATKFFRGMEITTNFYNGIQA